MRLKNVKHQLKNMKQKKMESCSNSDLLEYYRSRCNKLSKSANLMLETDRELSNYPKLGEKIACLFFQENKDLVKNELGY